MGRRHWCLALLLATSLGTVAVVAGSASPSIFDASREFHHGLPAVDGSIREQALDSDPFVLTSEQSIVGSVLSARRTVGDRGHKPLLLALATLSACAIAAASAVRRRESISSSSTRAFLPVPCGVRAPPALRFT